MTAGYVKRAALAIAIAAQRPDGVIPDEALARAAAAAEVTPRQVRRWLKAEAKHLTDGVAGVRDVPDPTPRSGWQVTGQVLAVVSANAQLKRAWQQLKATDPATPSYPAFTAALRNYHDNGIARAVKTDGASTLIGSRMYLRVEVGVRNARWELDSQEVPVHVIPSRGTKPVKLHQTTIIESKHRIVMATLFTPGPPRATDVAACIARAVLGRTYLLDGREVWVGGIPDEIAWDNAKSNLADVITELVFSLRTLGVPVTPYAGWEKGKIESWHGVSQVECYSTMPGYTEGPKSFTQTAYWGDHRSGDDLLGEDLLIVQGERWALEEYNIRRMHGRLGTIPLRSWAADTGRLRQATREQLMPAMLAAKHLRTVNKDGIRLDGVDYVAAELNRLVHRKVTVRYLPNLALEEMFIEVFDGEDWICTAFPSHTLTSEQRSALLATRRRQYEQLRAAEKEGARMRRAAADRTKASGAEVTTYGQNAAEYARDELAANTEELFGDALLPVVDLTEAPDSAAPDGPATGPEEPATVAGVGEDAEAAGAEPDAYGDDLDDDLDDDLGVDLDDLFGDEEEQP